MPLEKKKFKFNSVCRLRNVSPKIHSTQTSHTPSHIFSYKSTFACTKKRPKLASTCYLLHRNSEVTLSTYALEPIARECDAIYKTRE